MGKITDITRQKRNKSRVSIYIDGEFVCGLDAVTAVGSRLNIGGEISPEELKRIVFASEANSAFERAVGYLSLSPRSKKEIARYLKDKGYDCEVIEETIDRLEKYRYTDHYAYAESFVKSKSKKYGSLRLKSELRAKGISSDIIEEILNGVADGDEERPSESDNAYAIAQKYLRSHTSDKQKLRRFLAARGFTWDAIGTAVNRLSEDGAFDGDDEFYDN